MTAPVAPKGGFFIRSVTRFYACPSVANLKAPTRAEITAGVRLTKIVGISGFSASRSFLPVATLDSDYTGSVAGELTSGDCSLTFQDIRGDNTNRTVLADDVSLVLVKMDYGDIPGERCECWPVTSGGVNQQVDLASYGQYKVDFSTEAPEKNAVIPAAT